ncbi:MAG: glycosyltransferase family 4 protein [Magnetospirillum sp.]|nr:glycosyltransferase family 4 protein [Magnetospirillum sp.]
MRIAVHDYSGHPFQAQLSRHLASLGHHVLHLYCTDFETPRGGLTQPTDSAVSVEAVSISRPVPKYDFLGRWRHDHAYGGALSRRVLAFRPDVVLSANTPPAAQARLLAALRPCGIPLVIWVQDIFSIGVEAVLRNRPWPLRHIAGTMVRRIEFGTMRGAAALVVISPDFIPILASRGLHHPVTEIIENWAPLGEITPCPKDNSWSRRHGLDDRFVYLYSGTLGMKHNPSLLAELARATKDDGARVVVVSQGRGRRWLEEAKAREGLDSLVLLDFQPYEELSQVLGAADVAVVLLEDFAGALSVPSKIYSAFCAERPLLAAIPAANLAHRLIHEQQAGCCVAPTDSAGFIDAARRLYADPARRAQMSANQAAYAASHFDIAGIGKRFENLLERATRPTPPKAVRGKSD